MRPASMPVANDTVSLTDSMEARGSIMHNDLLRCGPDPKNDNRVEEP